MTKLTPKQENFCQEYIKTGNASEAYRKSYDTSRYTDKSVNEKASQFLKNVKIKSRIEELQKDLEKKHDITKDRVLRELANIAFMKESEFYNDDGSVKLLSELTPEQKSALASYGFKSVNMGDGIFEDVPIFKAQDKLKAIEVLTKMLGYNEPEKVEHSGEVTNKVIQVEWE